MTTTHDTTAVMRQALEALETCEWDGSHEPGSLWFDIDKAKEAIRALRTALAANGWQPIETAPRGSGEGGPHDTRDPAYIEPPTILLWTQEGQRVGYYDWYYHPGYGRGADPYESPWRCAEGGQAYGPTHWMPLPAAPVQTNGGENV